MRALRAWPACLPDGSKLERALYDITLKCPRNTNADVHDAPLRNLPIATDGTFSDVERFRYRETTTIRYDTERFSGRIGSAGASGTFSVVSRLANRRTGRTIATCRTGGSRMDGGAMSAVRPARLPVARRALI